MEKIIHEPEMLNVEDYGMSPEKPSIISNFLSRHRGLALLGAAGLSTLAFWAVFKDRLPGLEITHECIKNRAKVMNVCPVDLLKNPFMDPQGEAFLCMPNDRYYGPWNESLIAGNLDKGLEY